MERMNLALSPFFNIVNYGKKVALFDVIKGHYKSGHDLKNGICNLYVFDTAEEAYQMGMDILEHWRGER